MKLHQLIAITTGRKTAVEKEITEFYHKLQKADIFNGLHRTYKPNNEDGETFPDEVKNVQVTTSEIINEFSEVMTDLFNLIAQQDLTNCEAKADIVVDGNVLIKDVPATHLLFLEKKLIDVKTFISKLPTLDPSEKWEFDSNSSYFRSSPSKTNKTKKVLRNHVKAEATDKHPAQVDVYSEDEKIGEWTLNKFSGAIPASDKKKYLKKAQDLIEAVRIAKEQANTINVEDYKDGGKIFEYIFE